MAIIIQENYDKKIVETLIIGILILVGAAFLIYYLFFLPVPIAEDLARPDGYKNISFFAQADLDIESVMHSPTWRLLQKESLVPPLITEIIAPKANPFQTFIIRRR